jgi:hypothetical protein
LIVFTDFRKLLLPLTRLDKLPEKHRIRQHSYHGAVQL